MGSEPYISNQEMFMELRKDVKCLREDISNVRTELRTTQQAVRQYNGLREELSFCKESIRSIEDKAKARAGVGVSIREWGGWIIAIVTLLVLLEVIG